MYIFLGIFYQKSLQKSREEFLRREKESISPLDEGKVLAYTVNRFRLFHLFHLFYVNT